MLIDRLGNIEEKQSDLHHKQSDLHTKIDCLIAEQNMSSLERKWATFFRNLGWIVSSPGGMVAMSPMSPSLLVRTAPASPAARDKETTLSVFIEGKQDEPVTYDRLKKRCEALFELKVPLPFAVVGVTPVFDDLPLLGIVCYDGTTMSSCVCVTMGPWSAVSTPDDIWSSIFINIVGQMSTQNATDLKISHAYLEKLWDNIWLHSAK